MKKIENFINGKIISYSENFLPVFDPSKGEQIAEVINSNEKDFDQVIHSSEKSFDIWS